MKKLWLLRHAEASFTNSSDFARPLTQDGILTVEALCRSLSGVNKPIDKIVASPSKRTHATAKILKRVHFPHLNIDFVDSIYDATAEWLFRLVNNFADADQHILLVGHNPGLSDLASYLVGNQYINFTPGTLISLEFDLDHWYEVSGGTALLDESIYQHA